MSVDRVAFDPNTAIRSLLYLGHCRRKCSAVSSTFLSHISWTGFSARPNLCIVCLKKGAVFALSWWRVTSSRLDHVGQNFSGLPPLETRLSSLFKLQYSPTDALAGTFAVKSRATDLQSFLFVSPLDFSLFRP